MYHDPNSSALITCSVCGRQFRSSDGYAICSSACDRELERQQEENDNGW